MKPTFLKYFFFPALFLLVFQGLGRAEIGLGFGREVGEVTAASSEECTKKTFFNLIKHAPDDATRIRYSKAWNHLDLVESSSKLDPTVLTKLGDDLLDADFATFLEGGVGRVKAWEVAFKHGDDIRLNTDFLSNLNKHLDDFPNLKPDLDDIDVFNAYKQIADDVEQSYEILDDVEGNLALLIAQKTQNSNAQPFWYWLQKGKKFESEYLLPKFRNRSSTEYLQLKNKANSEFGIDLNQYDMYSQVQLKYNGNDYFVADQVYVKWVNVNGTQVIDDIVIVENKLKSTTRLTTNQNAGKASSSLEVRSIELEPESAVTGVNLTNTLPPITTNNKWLKVYDSENGDIISGIDKL